MTSVQRRGQQRGTVKKIVNSLSQCLTASVIEKSVIEAQLSMLRKHAVKLESLNEEVQTPLEDKEWDDDVTESLKRECEIETCIDLAEKILGRSKDANFQASQKPKNDSTGFVKLPTLSLPEFSGDPLEWPQFWDTYRNAVHENTILSGAQKFTYLIGQLKGDALMTLDGFQATDLHYSEAIKILQDHFGKPNLIVQAHLNKIFDLKCENNSCGALKKFRSTYECHLRGLKSMQQNVEEAGFVFVGLLLRKLPSRIRENINRANTANQWTLDSFCEAVNREIDLTNTIEEEKSTFQEKSHEALNNAELPSKKTNSFFRAKTTVGSFGIASKSSEVQTKCKFCFEQHYSDECQKYATLNDRTGRAKELSLCFNCLSNTHNMFKCKSKYTCRNCKRRHHSSLCKHESARCENKGQENSIVSSLTSIASTSLNRVGIALPTAMMPIKDRKYRVFFDQGSQETLILESLVHELKLKIVGKIKLGIDGINSDAKPVLYKVVMIPTNTSNKVMLQALAVKSLPSRIQMMGVSKVVKLLQDNNIPLADPNLENDTASEIKILIGANHYYEFIRGQTRWRNINLLSSTLGMILTGPLPSFLIAPKVDRAIKDSSIYACCSINDEIKKMWSLDNLGIQCEDTINKKEDVLCRFEESINQINGRYFVSLPWKENFRETLGNNFQLARGTLLSTLKKLKNEPKKLKAYNSIIQDYQERGFIEKLDYRKVYQQRNEYHFLPHHGVNRNSATTPLRIVFNCSAGKPSLNDCLHAGPSLGNDMCQVLMRFRIGKFACLSDISKAFLMIQLSKEDQKVTCFLWPSNPSDEESPLNVFKFRVVLFGATCSPFLLNATLNHHLKKFKSPAARDIQRNIYVDNVQFATDKENKLISFYKESKEILQDAGMDLCEWATNSTKLQDKIALNNDGRRKEVSDPGILGMKWNVEEDFLYFPDVDLQLKNQELTKRSILSLVSRIFDPIGFLTPITIRSRILMQTFWERKISWDEKLTSSEDCKTFSSLLSDLKRITEFGIPRQLKIYGEIILHAFSDASGKAYGTVIYATSREGSMLVASRARVSPLKALTIPKLELTAALLSTRLIKYIRKTYSEELTVDDVIYWTDSKVVISWISNGKLLPAYEKGRVKEILQNSKSEQWNYVDTKSNPADLLSRGTTVKHLLSSDLWFHGPPWLVDKSCWPLHGVADCKVLTSESDSILEAPAITVALQSSVTCCPIDIERYSTYSTLIRVTAYVFKASELIKRKRISLPDDCQITNSDMEKTEQFWIINVQNSAFRIEKEYLENSRSAMKNCPNIVKQLNLFIENGLLRCRGRIDNSETEYNAKFPILLPNNHSFTVLFIRNAHMKVKHMGVSSVVAFLRQSFWVPRLRQRVKSLLKNCVLCRKVQGLPYKTPNAPPLPDFRVQESRPFSVTGIDYTGALAVRTKEGSSKAYIILFTCAVTRAVHLEVVEDNSCEKFLLAFRRFAGRRSSPRYLLSDNAATFGSANKFLKKLQEDERSQRDLSGFSCTWKFIPSRAAWYGGMWERMISITKSTLKKVLGRSMISFEQLQTLVTETECVINNRPITYSTSDLNDFSALTPSHLLYGYRLDTVPEPITLSDPDFVSRENLTARQRNYRKVKEHLWGRWQKEYLLSLREQQIKNKKSTGQNIQRGEVVLVHDEVKPRLHWKLAKIVSLNISGDNIVRSAKLKTATGNISRPISKLYPLEVQENISNQQDKKLEKESSVQRRETRESARNARKLITEQMKL